MVDSINLNDLRKIFQEHTNVLILSGYSGIGKTSAVLKEIQKLNFDLKYFKYEENQNNYQKMLEILDLKDIANKYLVLANALTPGNSKKNIELMYYLVISKLDEIKNKENVVFVIDDLENFDKDFLTLFFNISSKYLKENSKSKIIAIYKKEKLNSELASIIQILKTQGAEELELRPYSKEDIKNILSDLGYRIPESIIEIFCEYSDCKIKNILDYIKILENKNYIIEKSFIKVLSKKTIDEIRGLISKEKEENILEKLTPSEIVLIIYLSLLNERIEAEKLMKLVNLNLDDFVNAVDDLIRKKLIIEDGDYLEIKDKDLISYLEKSFSKLRLRDARLKIANYFEKEGNYYKAGIQYYYSDYKDKAFELLSKEGMKFYNEGEYYLALETLSIANSIKQEKEITKIIIDILSLLNDYKEILKIIEEILKTNPNDSDYLLYYANALHNLSDFENSKKYYEIALENAQNEKQKAWALYGLGRYNYTIEDNEKAVNLLNESLKMSQEITDLELQEKILRILGNIEYENRNLNKALSYYEKSKNISESIGNYSDLASNYNNIANVSSELNFKEGKFFYSKAKEIAEKYWFPHILVTLDINLGIINEYEGNVKEAVYLLKRAYGTSIILNDYNSAINAILNLFDILVKMGNVQEAVDLLNIGIDLSKKSGKIYETLLLNALLVYAKNILNLNGNYENLDEIEKSNIKFYENYAKAIKYVPYFYSGDFKKAVEIYQSVMDKRLKNLLADDILDLMDFIEILVYKKFFENGIDDEVLKYLEVLEKSDLFPQLELIVWRYNILKAIEKLEKRDLEQAMKLYNENIEKIDSQNLKYLSSWIKINFGLYLYKNFNDKSVLEKGKEQLKSLNLKGAEKAYEKALSL